MKCSKCGSPLIPGSDFCKICGAKLESQNEPDVEIIDFESVRLEVETTNDDQTVTEISYEEVSIHSLEENNEPIAPEQPEIAIEPVVEEKEKPLEEAIEEYLDEMIPETKTKINIFPIVLLILLLLSIGINIYLYVSNLNKPVNNEYNEKEKVVTKDILYNYYQFTVLNDWKYEIDTVNNLLFLYDNSEDFGVSVQVVNETNYDLLVEDELATYMKEYNLQFTSSYAKNVNGKKMYLYKGKYGEYNTYLIFTRISYDIMGITKIMFDAEVDDVVLNNVLEMNSSITKHEPTTFTNDKFTFTDLSQPIIARSNELKESDE
ncbi:MAG: hypothetical protein ACM3O4_05025 [Ignavibacteriales bacterium]